MSQPHKQVMDGPFLAAFRAPCHLPPAPGLLQKGVLCGQPYAGSPSQAGITVSLSSGLLCPLSTMV